MTKPDETTLDAIRRLLQEVATSNGEIKRIKDMLTDVAEQNDEWREAQEEIKELTGVRTKARKLLEADKDYQAVHADLEEQRFKHKDLVEILSHHLVIYYHDTGDTSFLLDDNTELQIIIAAKPGK